MKLIASNQMTLTNLKEKAIDRTEVTFWHGLSATKHPLGVYDCGGRDHAFANEFDVVSGKKYTVRVIAQKTKGTINLKGGIWYTERTSGYQFDGLAALTLVGELSEDGLGIWERTLTVPNGKTKGRVYVQLEQSSTSGFSTAYRVYDAQVFDENGQPLVTDQNNFGALTSPMAAPDGTYIWKRTITHYTDGTNDTVWEYSGVGEKGNTGANGQTSHVHFAFADNATGGGFSLTTPKAYMGWYADFNESASNDPTKYRWSKWKGDQGAPGKPGADGKTSYFHMAYADSADGRTGFSFKESGQQYQGYYTDFTQTSSTDPTKYVWVDRLANVKVGGRNLLLYTADPWKAPNDYYQFGGVTKTDETLNGSIVYKTHTAWASLRANWGKHLIDRKNVKVGDEFTYSIYAKTDQSSMKVRLFDRFSGQSGADALTGEIALTNEWQKLSVTFKVTEKMVASQSKLSWVGFEQVKNSEDGKFVYYACNMLEEGNVPTPWTPALEDTQADIDSKADSVLTQEQLNALAEKNRNMEAEMAAKASLAEVERWKQAYDEYVAQNDADKTSAEQKLITLTSRVAEWVKDWEDKKVQWSFLDTNMDFGEEGLRLGKKGSPTSILISNDRIGFYSGGSEVASMSNGTLTIDNGIFAKSLQIGHYREEVYEGDKTINVIRWID